MTWKTGKNVGLKGQGIVREFSNFNESQGRISSRQISYREIHFDDKYMSQKTISWQIICRLVR